MVYLFLIWISVIHCFQTICLFYSNLLLPNRVLLLSTAVLLILFSFLLFLNMKGHYYLCVLQFCEASPSIKMPNPRLEPWLNDKNAVELKRVRKRKGCPLRESLCGFHKTVKVARLIYFISLLLTYSPSVFNTLNSVPNVHEPVHIRASSFFTSLWKIYSFLLEKVVSTRDHISPPASILIPYLAVFDCLPLFFRAAGFQYDGMTLQSSPFDVIPPRLPKEVFPTLLPSILTIINSSLTSGMMAKKFACC